MPQPRSCGRQGFGQQEKGKRRAGEGRAGEGRVEPPSLRDPREGRMGRAEPYEFKETRVWSMVQGTLGRAGDGKAESSSLRTLGLGSGVLMHLAVQDSPILVFPLKAFKSNKGEAEA